MVDKVKKTVDEYKQKFDEYKQKIEDAVDKYGGKWIKAGLFIKEHGEKAYQAGKSCFDHIKKGLSLLKEKKWDDAGQEVDARAAGLRDGEERGAALLREARGSGEGPAGQRPSRRCGR